MLGVVVPAFNEEERVRETVRAVLAAFPSALVVVADDGSADRTAAEAEEGGALVVALPENRGKGAAVREGVLEALRRGCAEVLFTDCDLACPPGEWGKLLAPLRGGSADVAVASRWLGDSRVEGRTPTRALASWCFAALARRATGLPYRDFQCGCKAFTRGAALALFSEPLSCERYAFDVEVLLRARLLSLRVVEVPVLWRAGGASRVRLLRHGPEMLLHLLRLRREYLGRPPVSLSTPGPGEGVGRWTAG
ncbi:glycosyl transferase family 2 [Ammonifex degensii KC4]|uniref:Glycosyl transferase family 2 n=1 Tax=Ammonifex degensii (strain DSM 10501 / KC4) TaxID=429009 RepID=C9RCD1_AMMDK|nr:glycosyl transferase family 2 [Ammonifex degensii KC4]